MTELLDNEVDAGHLERRTGPGAACNVDERPRFVWKFGSGSRSAYIVSYCAC